MRGARVAVAGASDGVWAKSQYIMAPVPMEMKRAFCRRVLLSGFMGFGESFCKITYFFCLLGGLDLIFVCFLWIFVYLCGVEFYV